MAACIEPTVDTVRKVRSSSIMVIPFKIDDPDKYEFARNREEKHSKSSGRHTDRQFRLVCLRRENAVDLAVADPSAAQDRCVPLADCPTRLSRGTYRVRF